MPLRAGLRPAGKGVAPTPLPSRGQRWRKAFAVGGALREAKKIKFVRIIGPGNDVRLVLTQKGEGEIAFEFREGDALCSSGTLVF